MNKGEVISLFSTPVYVSQINADTKPMHDYARQCNYYQPEKGLWLSEDYYLTDLIPGFKELISEHVNNYLYNILEVEESFKYVYSDSWFVKMNTGGCSLDHDHPNSLYSGIYYFDTEYTNAIHFKLPSISTGINISRHTIKYKRINQYNCKSINITPESGTIILFPSNLYHSVDPNTSSRDRYTFAFNILPRNISCDIVGQRIQPERR